MNKDLPPSYEEIVNTHSRNGPSQQTTNFNNVNTNYSSSHPLTGDAKTTFSHHSHYEQCHTSPSYNPRYNHHHQSYFSEGVPQQQQTQQKEEDRMKKCHNKKKKRRESCTSFGSCYSSNSSSCSSSSSSSPKKRDKRKSQSIMHIKDVNIPLNWEDAFWEGKKFTLMTTNNKINVNGDIDAKEIHFETTNAFIEWRSNFLSARDLKIKTSNANINLGPKGQINVKHNCKIETSNAKLIWEDIELHARELNISTSNAKVYIDHIHVAKELTVKTSNAPVELFITSSNPKIEVQVTTCNAPITLHMPKEFAGEFKLNTSGYNKSVIIQDSSNSITFDDVKKLNSRKGHRLKKNGGYLKATTSEGNITVLFDS